MVRYDTDIAGGSGWHRVGVEETYLNDSTDYDLHNTAGYYCYRQDRTNISGKETGGGILIYVKTRGALECHKCLVTLANVSYVRYVRRSGKGSPDKDC